MMDRVTDMVIIECRRHYIRRRKKKEKEKKMTIQSYIGKNIRYLRRKRGLTQEEVADRMGYKSFTTVQKWETGDVEPNFKTAQKLAELFGVTLNDMAYTDMEADERTKGYGTITIKGKDQTGTNFEYRDEQIDRYQSLVKALLTDQKNATTVPILSGRGTKDSETVGKIAVSKKMRDAGAFGFRINGMDMSPEFQDGDTVIVERDADIKNGDYVLVSINGGPGTCRKYRKETNGTYLNRVNPICKPNFFPIDPDPDHKNVFRIMGKVVQNRRNYG